jgi:hypothetical protein
MYLLVFREDRRGQGGEDVAFDAGNLHEPENRVTGQAGRGSQPDRFPRTSCFVITQTSVSKRIISVISVVGFWQLLSVQT